MPQNNPKEHGNQIEDTRLLLQEEDRERENTNELLDTILAESQDGQKPEPMMLLFAALEKLSSWAQLMPFHKVIRIRQMHEQKFKGEKYTGIRQKLSYYETDLLKRALETEEEEWNSTVEADIVEILLGPCVKKQVFQWQKKASKVPWRMWLGMIMLQVQLEDRIWGVALEFIKQTLPEVLPQSNFTGKKSSMIEECKLLDTICQRLDRTERAAKKAKKAEKLARKCQ
ncbi:hypothetical protein NEDG_02043 [Nematocida displodere]|uniref:Uncharacterized protein n=1 Tax=Nematocida displodere TaxID=1805483 RepID=A0A177EMF1_9MICR|nr:hypothetical protein NEDG_02043 [Nematocida displodere]